MSRYFFRSITNVGLKNASESQVWRPSVSILQKDVTYPSCTCSSQHKFCRMIHDPNCDRYRPSGAIVVPSNPKLTEISFIVNDKEPETRVFWRMVNN